VKAIFKFFTHIYWLIRLILILPFFLYRLGSESKNKTIIIDSSEDSDESSGVEKEKESSHYPEEIGLQSSVVESINIGNGSDRSTLSICYTAKEPEDSDILVSKSEKAIYHIHPNTIFDEIKKGENLFLSSLSAELLQTVPNSSCMSVSLRDDCRDKYDIKISEHSILVPAHYLCLTFYIYYSNGKLFTVTDGMLNNDYDEVPLFYKELDMGLFLKNTAISESEEDWAYTDDT